MKADVINALTGLTVLAVPGVNTLTQLELTLTELRSEGLVEIKTAFDMDFATNHHVQNGYNNLCSCSAIWVSGMVPICGIRLTKGLTIISGSIFSGKAIIVKRKGEVSASPFFVLILPYNAYSRCKYAY